MESEGLDCVVIWGDRSDFSNVRYLTNFEDFYGGETAIVVPLRGEVGMTTNAIMHGEPMHSGIQDAWPRDVRCAAAPRTAAGSEHAVTIFDHIEDFIAEASPCETIGLAGLSAASQVGDFLTGKLPGVEIRRADNVLDEMRKIKSPREVDVMRKACATADAALIAAMGAVQPGATEFDMAAAAHKAMFEAGAETTAFPIAVVAGERCGFKHMAPTGYVIKSGDMVYTDLGGRYMGYYSDSSRQTVCGAPTNEQLRFMETQVQIVEACMAAAKPGVRIADLARIGIAMAEEAGYGDYLYFRGHGVGCATHDRPAVTPANQAPLEPGMVFAFEPMLVRFRFGTACWEDIWHVTTTGVERLNTSPYRYW